MKFPDMHQNLSNILVTGGCGFIGSHLVPFLLYQGHSVTVLDDLSTGSLSNIPINNPKLTLIKGSVLDAEVVKQAATGCDMIFHLASTVGMKLVYSKPKQSYLVSKVGTENIMLTDKHIPVVLFSSSAVYGLTSEESMGEDISLPLEEALAYDSQKFGYAAGKWELENIGKKHMKEGRKVMILRPFNVVGTGQSSNYGMVVPNFIKNSLAGKPLTIYNDGEQTRSFTCAETFTEILYRLIQHPEAWELGNNIINIGSKNCISINHLAEVILTACNSNSKIVYKPYEAVFPNKVDVKHRIPNLTRFTKLVGKVEWPEIQDIVTNMVKKNENLVKQRI